MSSTDHSGGALTIDGAAQYVGVSRASIYRLIQRGELTPRKIGRRTVIARADLDRMIEGAPTMLRRSAA